MSDSQRRPARLHVVVPAAGNGTRFGGHKQYADLAGCSVVVRTLERLRTGLAPHALYVAVARDDVEFEHLSGCPPGVHVLRCGGATRAATVANALHELVPDCADDDWIAVHDAVRPCVPLDALARLVQHLADGDIVGALLAVPVADTLKRATSAAAPPTVVATVSRTDLWQAQTPQVFRFGVLRRALAQPGALAATDEAQAVEALGLAPRLVRGSDANIKITHAEDLALATAILAAQTNGRVPA